MNAGPAAGGKIGGSFGAPPTPFTEENHWRPMMAIKADGKIDGID